MYRAKKYIYNVSYSKEKMYFIIPNMLFQTVNTHAKPQEILPVLESHLHIIVIIAVMSPPPDQATCTQQDQSGSYSRWPRNFKIIKISSHPPWAKSPPPGYCFPHRVPTYPLNFHHLDGLGPVTHNISPSNH